MYPYVFPADLSREYQARVAKAVRQHELVTAARQVPRIRPNMMARLQLWLAAARSSRAQQPAAEASNP